MKYLDAKTGKEVAIYPWTDTTLKRIVENNPNRFLKLIEE